jgi:predicted MFS family arabinose efflux permease
VAASRWRLLGYLTAAYAAGAFGVLGVSPLSPALHEAFGLSRFQVGLLLPAVYVGGLIVSMPAGRLADRIGARTCLLGGLALSGFLLAASAGVTAFAALLACLVVAGVGWSIVNPAIGRAIIEVFPGNERGLAMGIKQMGLTVGGVASAVVLPGVAGAHGWRVALGLCALVALIPVAAGWRPLRPLAHPVPDEGAAAQAPRSSWWWLRRPPLVLLFAAGLGLGMTQSAVLGYLPLFGTQGLRLTPVGAGGLLAVAQIGATAARLALGFASDRWLGGQRIPWLVATAMIGAATMLGFAWPGAMSPRAALAVAFWIGVGAFGWVGIYLVLTAEVGGRDQAGLLTGVAMAVIFTGILVGAPLFGLLLERADSFAVPWLVFAGLSAAVGVALWAARRAIQRERRS